MIYFFVFHVVRAWESFTKYILGFYWIVGTASQAKLLAKFNRCSINYDSVNNNIKKKNRVHKENVYACVSRFYFTIRKDTRQSDKII